MKKVTKEIETEETEWQPHVPDGWTNPANTAAPVKLPAPEKQTRKTRSWIGVAFNGICITLIGAAINVAAWCVLCGLYAFVNSMGYEPTPSSLDAPEVKERLIREHEVREFNSTLHIRPSQHPYLLIFQGAVNVLIIASLCLKDDPK